MSGQRGLTILGSTGSIGQSTLDVVARHPERFKVASLCAFGSADKIVAQALACRPARIVLGDTRAADEARRLLAARGERIEVSSGTAALAAAASDPAVDTVMAAIVGSAGLMPTLAAIRAGKRVLLANKESLVMAGPLFMAEVARAGALLIPVDSEHNAIFQCMPGDFRAGRAPAGVTRIVLTASGGPFRLTAASELPFVTPVQACAHPKWSMGRKISVDSATLMNKGLEVIEASWLFALPESQIEVLVHPQSLVHSLVEYADGSLLAQMGCPDMRTPIAQALGWPDRLASGVQSLNLATAGSLEFEIPDLERFPSLALAREAARAGGTAPAVLNAANEVAVEAFLERRLNFTGMFTVIDRVLQQLPQRAISELQDVIAADASARSLAHSYLSPDRSMHA